MFEVEKRVRRNQSTVKSEEERSLFEGYVDDYFVKGEIDTIYLSRKINTHLFASDHVPPPKRRWARVDVNIPVKLEVRSVSYKGSVIQGEAILANISRMGAYLINIRLESVIDRNEQYQVILKVDQPPLNDWDAASVFVNFRNNNTSGLRFLKLSKKNHIKLLLMVDI